MNNSLDVSKTERKKRMHMLRDMAIALAGYSPETWQQLALDKQVCHELSEYNRLSRQAKKRQGQYLGKLLRTHLGEEAQTNIEQFFAQKKQSQRYRSSLAAHMPQVFSQLLRQQIDIQQVQQILPQVDMVNLQITLQHAQASTQKKQLASDTNIIPVGKAQKKLWGCLLAGLPKE